jgi:demethylmenaquinone methyltransferase/2-methoxy-6-polyprenyl-1,4-benzoquinol methylase
MPASTDDRADSQDDASPRARHARGLFDSIAQQYDVMAALLSFGQDGRWRRFLVSRVPREATLVLDVATGTGMVAAEVCRRTDARVVGLDQSDGMLAAGRRALGRAGVDGRVSLVRGGAERLPFPDDAFDALTFTYLLRYVDDPSAAMRELSRVVAPGGVVAMLEFAEPSNPAWRAAWAAYTRIGLPLAGGLASPAWYRTGRFLGPSISGFSRRYPFPVLADLWRDAGLRDVRWRTMSMGGAFVMWGRRGSGEDADMAPP